METTSSYMIAWLVYIVAVGGAQLLAWRISRVLRSPDLRAIFQLVVLAALITPARLEEGANYWVPAFMVALMEGLNDGMEVALNRLLPMMVTMLVFILLSVVVRRIKSTVTGAIEDGGRA